MAVYHQGLSDEATVATTLAMRDSGVTVDVYRIKDTLEFVAEKLMDGSLYPPFLEFPSPETPIYSMHEIEPLKDFQVLDYTVKAVPVPYAVPAVGFMISSDDVSVFYTGDAARGVSDAWQHASKRRCQNSNGKKGICPK